MKHLLTISALLVSSLAMGQSSWPWNPDFDGNNLIGVEDLMSVLSVYNAEFFVEYEVPEDSQYTLALVKSGDEIIRYIDCLRYCTSIGGHIITTSELALFEAEIAANTEWEPSGGGTNIGNSYVNYDQKIYAYDDDGFGRGYRRQITIYPEGFFGYNNDFFPAGDTIWGKWTIGTYDASFSQSQNAWVNPSRCFCAGTVPNSGFSNQ